MFLQEVTGYRSQPWRAALCHACCVLSAGLLLLLFHWRPSLRVRAMCKPCALGRADWVIIRVSAVGGGVVSGMGFPACIRRDAACACRIDSGSASLHACRRRCWVRAGEQSPHYLGGIWEGGAFVEINVCSLPRAAWSITPGPGWRTARAASLLAWQMRRRAGTPSACTRRR